MTKNFTQLKNAAQLAYAETPEAVLKYISELEAACRVKPKTVTAWAVFSPCGYMFIASIDQRQKRSIEKLAVGDSWVWLMKIGYTCRKIQILEAKND